MLRFTLGFLILSLWCVSCAGSGGSSGGGSPAARTASGSSSGSPGSGGVTDLDREPAAKNRVRNARIILRQIKGNQDCVLVNFNHSQRSSRDGRLALLNGDTRQVYKVLSDRFIDDLIEFFKQQNAAVIREPWQPGDERYLRAGEGEIDGFRGIIVLENDGRIDKYMHWRPANPNDAVGQKRQQIFVALKAAVATQFNAVSRTESVDAAIVTEDEFNALDRRR